MLKNVLLLASVLSMVYALDRKISSNLNPGCTVCTSNDTTLMYVRAQGFEDTIHQIWDFTQGIPTMIFVIAGTNSSMHITWMGKKPEWFRLSEKPKYSFAVVIDKLYEYNDEKDIGQIDPKSPHKKAYSLRHLTWNRTNFISSESEAMVELQVNLFKADNGWRRGEIGIKVIVLVCTNNFYYETNSEIMKKISAVQYTWDVTPFPISTNQFTPQLDLLPFIDYGVELPHLIHTANSTLMDISLVDMMTSSEYNASRFAWHLILVSTDPAMDTMHCAMRKSLDDEHTPGVFEIIEIKTPESYYRSDGGFIQFRPVGYTTRDRGVTSSIISHVSPLNRTHLPAHSTVGRFYEKFDSTDLLIQDIFVSFGETGDGFYQRHNYTAWSFTVGYGAPPMEGFSMFVILVISIGLGVPVLLALSGIIYVVSRRCKQRNAPRRFTDAE